MFYLKNLAQQPQIPIPLSARNRCHDWAFQNYPLDGESLFWIGHRKVQHSRTSLTAIIKEQEITGRKTGDYMSTTVSLLHWDEMNTGLTALEKVADTLDPFCIRALVFLGLAYSIRWSLAAKLDRNNFVNQGRLGSRREAKIQQTSSQQIRSPEQQHEYPNKVALFSSFSLASRSSVILLEKCHVIICFNI